MPRSLTPPPENADGLLEDMFGSISLREGGMIRRNARDIDRLVGRDFFVDELRRRGYRAVENAGQIVVFCNTDKLRVLS